MQKAKPGYNLVKWLFGKYEEIPEEWDLVRQGDACELINGYAYSANEFKETGYPIIRIQNLTGGKNFVYSDVKLPEKQFAKEGDLLFAWSATFGPFIWDGPKAAYHYHQWKIISKNNSDKKFLFYHLYRITPIIKTMGQSGLGMFHMTKGSMETLKMKLPPLKQQQKIASILSNVDELISSYDKSIESTKKLKTGLMQTLLTKGIGHKKFKKVPWLFGKEIEIPEEWELGKLGEHSTLKGRIGWQGLTTKEYREKGEFYLVTGTDFKKGKIDWENCVFVDKDRFDQDLNIQLKNDDVLITKDGTIGKIAVVDKHLFPATLNTGVFVVRPIEKKYLPLILYYILNSNYFLKFLNRFKGGSTINHLYQKDFVKFSFPIPPINEQKKIVSILSSVDDEISKMELKKKSAESLKKGLMQKLLTGQIRVKV